MPLTEIKMEISISPVLELKYLTKSKLFSEFLTIAHANPLSLSLKAVFEELDVDGDGHITRSELRTAFQRMGHTLTDTEIKAIYKHVDVNQDGKINFQEFCLMMTRKKP